MVTQVRGKFFVMGVKRHYQTGTDCEITLGAVSASDKEASENNLYHKFTPSGEIRLQVNNPAAAEFFTLGKTVYVDFTEAPAQ